MSDSLTETHGVFYFLFEWVQWVHADVHEHEVEQKHIARTMKKVVWLDWLSKIALADSCLPANMIDKECVIHIRNVACTTAPN